jgi:hypothetical protein
MGWDAEDAEDAYWASGGPLPKWVKDQRREEKLERFRQLYGGDFQHKGTVTGRFQVTHPTYDPGYDAIVYPDGTVITREERGGSMDFTMADRIAAIERQREEKKRIEEWLATLPAEPGSESQANPPLVPVIYFKHQFKGSDKVYQYAALKSDDGKWYTTGPKSPKGYTWHELLLWLLETSHNTELPPIVSSYIEDWRDLTDVSNA